MRLFALIMTCLATIALNSSAVISSPMCIIDWTPDVRPEHINCTAMPIDPGVPSFTGPSPLWRWHNPATFNKGADQDKDCRLNMNCTYSDISENGFDCTWNLQRYLGGAWVDADDATIDSDCTGVNWRNTHQVRPDIEYRARVFVNDTSGDGPHGDDPGVYRHSSGVMLLSQDLVNWRLRYGFPKCDVDAVDGSSLPGNLGY